MRASARNPNAVIDPATDSTPQYRAQFTGSIRWQCGECYSVNAHRLTPCMYRLTCRHCRIKVIIGPVFYKPVRGGRTDRPPSDQAIYAELDPDYCEPMPASPELSSWRPGDPVMRYGRILENPDPGEDKP